MESNHSGRFGKLVFGLLAVLLLVGITVAQTQFGTLSGKVTDPNDAVVPDARVTVTNLSTQTKRPRRLTMRDCSSLAMFEPAITKLRWKKRGSGERHSAFTSKWHRMHRCPSSCNSARSARRSR